MVLETAFIQVQPGRVEEFLQVLPTALEVVSGADGFIDAKVQRGIERANTVLITLRWRTLEDHTVGFRESDRFTQWRAIISPFFDAPPTVEHWEIAG